MKTKLLALPFLLTAFVGTAPAHAQGVRLCEIDDARPDQTNTFTFSPLSATSGNWTWSFTGRVCLLNSGASAPASSTLTGTYFGDPCVAMVLTGQANGVLTGGALGIGAGVTHAGPGTGYLAIESVHVLTYTNGCLSASAHTIQVHVT